MVWLPLVAGVVITAVAVKTAEILPLMGPAGLLKLQILYPFALLLKQPQLGLSEVDGERWSQIVLYAQWIVYGLYITIATRWTAWWRALIHVGAVHLFAFAVLLLLTRI